MKLYTLNRSKNNNYFKENFLTSFINLFKRWFLMITAPIEPIVLPYPMFLFHFLLSLADAFFADEALSISGYGY